MPLLTTSFLPTLHINFPPNNFLVCSYDLSHFTSQPCDHILVADTLLFDTPSLLTSLTNCALEQVVSTNRHPSCSQGPSELPVNSHALILDLLLCYPLLCPFQLQQLPSSFVSRITIPSGVHMNKAVLLFFFN